MKLKGSLPVHQTTRRHVPDEPSPPIYRWNIIAHFTLSGMELASTPAPRYDAQARFIA